MKLTRLRVSNFRNIAFADLQFVPALQSKEDFSPVASAGEFFRHEDSQQAVKSGARIFFFGENGQGKTNLLEATSLLTALRSFRTRDSRLLVRHAEKLAQVSVDLEHEIEGATKILLGISITGKKNVEIGTGTLLKKMSEFVGRFPVVVFSSEDIALVRGSPTLRRRWLDVSFSAVDANYLSHLQRYYRALEARNKLLKAPDCVPAQCEAFEAVMAESGDFLARARERDLAEVAGTFAEIAQRILKTAELPQLIYLPSGQSKGVPAWRQFFADARRTDLLFHATQKGPHRDDFQFRLGGKNAADFASEGQQRGLSLALGLAQLSFFRTRTKIAPVVLADDVLGELDPIRRENFWNEVGDDLQVIATGTVLPADASAWQVFHVRAGTFIWRS